MERNEDHAEDLIELGVASVETRGPAVRDIDQTGGIHLLGLSND